MPRYNARTPYMRNSITTALNNLWEYPLTVVEAPMGYGKTTAVKEYLKGCETRVLWQTLTDDSVSVFWHGFSCLFKELDCACSESLVIMGVPDNRIFIEEAIRVLEGVNFPERTVIVIDDYHLLSSEYIDNFIELLVKAELPNLHIVIISRSVFGENLMELVIKGYCYTIGKRLFEFGQSEIVEYYKRCGIKLSADEADIIYSYTEGWISAIYLCVLGTLQDGELGQQASLYELIDKGVYRQYSVEVKEFLLHICGFDSFSLEQAEYMWAKGNAKELLMQIMANNAFIKYDQVSSTYYMHNLFTTYLRRIFDRQDVQEQRIVWQTAGKWHLHIGDYIHAMNFFYKAADFAGILIAVEMDKGNSIYNEHKEKLIKYFSECPQSIKSEHPWASLIYAINLFSFNEMELFAAECQEMGELIQDNDRLNEHTKRQLAGELELLCSFSKYNRLADMHEHSQRACQLLDGPSSFISRESSWTFGSPSVLYMFYRESGHLEQEVQVTMRVMPSYCQVTAGHGAGAEWIMQAERYYFIGDFENAAITAHKAMQIAQSQEQVASILCTMFLQIRLAFVKGDLAYVTGCLQQMREEVKRKGLYIYMHTIDLCEGFIYSYLAQEQNVPLWIVQNEVQKSCLFFPSHAFFNVIYGKVLLIANQHLTLLGSIEQFIQIAAVFPNLLGQVYTYIYEAIARRKLNHHQEAQDALKKAADIASPDQLIMPFVENGEHIIELLIELEVNPQYAKFVAGIRATYLSFEKQVRAMKDQLSKVEGLSTLTEREREIAELVATGLSNQAIARTLFIAEITVKKALQNIYAKLGVSNRTALVRRMAV